MQPAKEALNKVILPQEGIYKVLILLDSRLRWDYERGFNQRLPKESLIESPKPSTKKASYKGLVKNAVQVFTLLGLANLYMLRGRLGVNPPKTRQ